MQCHQVLFWRFLGVHGEPEATAEVRSRCGVISRREFDQDAAARERLQRLIVEPFEAFVAQSGPDVLADLTQNADKVHCRYCGEAAQLLTFGQSGYPYRASYGPSWVCVGCDAWVGCHPGTITPLGGLANAELRGWKIQAHAAFDPLWQGKMRRDKCSKGRARRAGYEWLAQQLSIPFNKTHIGYMDVDQCKRVVEICNAVFNQV